jgi:hypothetical protein
MIDTKTSMERKGGSLLQTFLFHVCIATAIILNERGMDETMSMVITKR